MVVDELKGELTVVALNGKDLVQQLLQPLHRTSFRGHIILVEPPIGIPLYFNHIGHLDKIVRTSKGVALSFFTDRNELGHGLKDLPCQLGEIYAEIS